MGQIEDLMGLEKEAWQDIRTFASWNRAWNYTGMRIEIQRQKGILSPEVERMGFIIGKDGHFTKK